MKVRIWLALAAVALGTPACAAEQRSYGTPTAGPTRTSTPSPRPDVQPSPAPHRSASRRSTSASVCDLFTTAEISRWLGLAVAHGASRSREGYRVCTWRALDAPTVPAWRVGDPVLDIDNGIVTITRGRASRYADLEEAVTDVAVAQGAAGRQELFQVGGSFAFAIGASVSGVPIWKAVALDGEAVVAVEVSGADSNSSLATVSDFLARTLRRQ